MTGDRDFNPDDVRLVDLLRQIQALSPEGATTAGRITLRDAHGAYVGEALVDSKALDAAAAALLSVNEMAACDRAEHTRAGDDTPAVRPSDSLDLDPLLEADFEEHCIGLDPAHLMALATIDPARAVAAFDELTAQDGDL